MERVNLERYIQKKRVGLLKGFRFSLQVTRMEKTKVSPGYKARKQSDAVEIGMVERHVRWRGEVKVKIWRGMLEMELPRKRKRGRRRRRLMDVVRGRGHAGGWRGRGRCGKQEKMGREESPWRPLT